MGSRLKSSFLTRLLRAFVAQSPHGAARQAPEGATGFVTSDHPVGLQFIDPAMRGGFHGVGYGLAKTEVLFSISNELALRGTLEPGHGEIDVDQGWVAIFNTNLIAHAQRQIYARADDFAYVSPADGSLRRGANLLADPYFEAKRTTPPDIEADGE